MAEMIPEGEIRRIDSRLEAETHPELSGIISPEDRVKDASTDCESPRVFKRKSIEEEGKQPSSSQMSTVKRFKMGKENQTVGVISFEKHVLKENFVTINETKILSASKSSLENEETMQEIRDKTGLSHSHFLNTYGARMLADNFLKNHNVTESKEEIKVRSKKEPIPIISSEIIKPAFKIDNITSNQEKTSKAEQKPLSEMSPNIAVPSYVQNANLTKGSNSSEQGTTEVIPNALEMSSTPVSSIGQMANLSLPEQEDPEICSRNQPSDIVPQISCEPITNMTSTTEPNMSITGKQSETQLQENANVEYPPQVKMNPLRAFRIYKTKSSEAFSEMVTVVKKPRIEDSSEPCSVYQCTTPQSEDQNKLFKPYNLETLSSTPPEENNQQTILSQHVFLPNAQEVRYNSEQHIPGTFCTITPQNMYSTPQLLWQMQPSRATLNVDSSSATVQCELGDNPSVISYQRTSLNPQQVWQTDETAQSNVGYSQNENIAASANNSNLQQSAFCQHLVSGEYAPDKGSCASFQNTSSVAQQLWQPNNTQGITIQPGTMSNILPPSASEAFPDYSNQTSLQVVHSDRCTLGQHFEHSAIPIQMSSTAPQQPCQAEIIQPYVVLQQNAYQPILQHVGYTQNENSKISFEHSPKCTLYQHQELGDNNPPKPTEIDTSSSTLVQDASSTLLQNAVYSQNENLAATPKDCDQTSHCYDDRYTVPQKVQQLGSDKLFTYSTPHLQQFGQVRGTENAPILVKIPDSPTTLQQPKLSQQEMWIEKIPGHAQHSVAQIGHCPQELNKNSSLIDRKNIENSHIYLKVPNNYTYIILEQPEGLKIIQTQLPNIPCQGLWRRGGTEHSLPRSLLYVLQQGNAPCQQNFGAVHSQSASQGNPQTGINQVQLATLQNAQQQPKSASQDVGFERSHNKSPEIIQIDESSNSSVEGAENTFSIDWEKGIIENFQYSLKILEKQHQIPSWRKSPEIIELDESSDSSLDEVENSFNIDWEKGIIENSQDPSVQNVEEQQDETSSQDVSDKETGTDRSENGSPEIIQIDESSKSSLEEEVEDAFNVKLAAEALNLLKTNSEKTSKAPKQDETPGLPTGAIVPDLTNSDVSNADTSLEDLSNTETQPSDVPKSPTKQRILFDPSLEITDVVTGAKIPFESLCLRNSETSEIEAIDSGLTTGNHKMHSDTCVQLSDSVTCSKVIPGVEEASTKQNEPSYITIQITTEKEGDELLPKLQITKCVKYPSERVTLPKNIEITLASPNAQSRHGPLEVAENPTKHVLSKESLQLSKGNICVHVPLEVIGLTKEQKDSGTSHLNQTEVGITKCQIISNSLLNLSNRPNPILVKISLNGIFLPKYAGTGIKIPFDAPCWPRNKKASSKKTTELAVESNRNEDNSVKKLEQENRKMMKPIQLRKQVKKTGKSHTSKYEITKKREHVCKVKKLPLEPRLRKARRGYIKELNEIRRCHLPVKNFGPKPILAAPKVIKNEGRNVSSPKPHKPIITPPKPVEKESSNIQKPIIKQQPVDKDEKKLEQKFKIPLIRSTKTSDDLLTESKPSPSVFHPSNAIKQEVKHSKQLKSPRVETSVIPKKEIKKKETTLKAEPQIEEFKNRTPSRPSSRVSDITKREVSPLQSGSDKDEDLKKNKTTSQKVEKIGSTERPDTPKPMPNEPMKIKTPVEAFKLLINDDMIRRILKHTNVRIAMLSDKSRSKRNCFTYSAKEVELKAFLGLLLLSAALEQSQTSIPNIWCEFFGPGIFRATLPEQRFEILLQCICFGDSKLGDSSTIPNDFTPIGDLWEEYLKNCKQYSTNETNDCTCTKYSTVRKTPNMALRVLFKMLDGTGQKGLAMYNQAKPAIKMSQRDYFKDVGMSLVRAQLTSRLLKSSLRNKERHLIETILKKNYEKDPPKTPSTPPRTGSKQPKRCQLCPWTVYRKTKYECECCQRPMCKEHRAEVCSECINELT